MTEKTTSRPNDVATTKPEEKDDVATTKEQPVDVKQVDHPRAIDVDYEAVKAGIYANLDAAVAGRESAEPGKSPGGTKAFDHEPPQLVGPQTREGHRPEIKAAIKERDRRAGINTD